MRCSRVQAQKVREEGYCRAIRKQTRISVNAEWYMCIYLTVNPMIKGGGVKLPP